MTPFVIFSVILHFIAVNVPLRIMKKTVYLVTQICFLRILLHHDHSLDVVDLLRPIFPTFSCCSPLAAIQ